MAYFTSERSFGPGLGDGKNHMTTKGNKIFSYNTCIFETLPDGRTVGNVTRYSTTTSRHQSKAGSYTAGIRVDDVPVGAQSLAEYVEDLSASQSELCADYDRFLRSEIARKR